MYVEHIYGSDESLKRGKDAKGTLRPIHGASGSPLLFTGDEIVFTLFLHS